MIDVLIDESFQRIDKKLVKVNICAVETNRGLIQKSIQEIQEYVLKDKIRFPNTKDKFHFSSLNEGQKALIVDKISKLDFDSKIFTYYLFDTTESESKKFAMERTVASLSKIHGSKKILFHIEHADEYVKSGVSDFLEKDYFDFILPDLILSVYSKHLNETKESTASNAMLYKLLKPRIRLQIFHSDKYVAYAERSNRI